MKIKRLLSAFLALAMVVSMVAVPVSAEDIVPCTKTEGCTLAEGHEGECSVPTEPETTYCENESCLLHKAQAHETCQYCDNADCTLRGEAHTECNVPTEPPAPTEFCTTEGCLLRTVEEHSTCKYCNTAGCTVTAAHAEEACFVPCDKDEDCALAQGHENGCQLGCTCPIEGGVHIATCTMGYYTAPVANVTVGEVTTSYTDLQEAFTKAPDGATITLLDNLTLSSEIYVSTSGQDNAGTVRTLTVDGGNKKITSSAGKSFRVYDNVTFKNITIENTAAAGRCIDTRSAGLDLTLNNVTLSATGSGNTQPLTIGGSGDDAVKVTITGSSIRAGNSGYAVITFVPVNMTITGSTVASGYGVVYIQSPNSVFNIQGATLNSTNTHSGTTNAFGTVIFQSSGVTFNVDAASTIGAASTGDQPQACFLFNSPSNVKVQIADGATLNGMVLLNYLLPMGEVRVPVAYKSQLDKDGYVQGADGVVTGPKPTAENSTVGSESVTVTGGTLPNETIEAIQNSINNNTAAKEPAKDLMTESNAAVVNAAVEAVVGENADKVENIEVYVEITHEEIEVLDDSGNIMVKFDVTPKVAVTTSASDDPVEKEISAWTDPITFRLPVPFDSEYVFVYHEGQLMGRYEVKTEGGHKYVEVSSKSFSEYGIKAAAPVVAVDQAGNEYESLEEALNASAAREITLKRDITLTESVTVPSSKKVKLNLEDKTITLDGNAVIENKGILTITASTGKIAAGEAANVIENAGTVVINSGEFTGKLALVTGGKYLISGGKFSAPVNKDYCAEGLVPCKNTDGTYGVGTLPNAEVISLGATNITEYTIYNGSLTEGADPINLQIAMQFLAKDTPEQAAANAFGNYTTDFFITMDGMAGDSIVMDEDCYLAGNYGTFGWIMIPLDGMKIVDGKVYPVITTVGFDFKYVDICTSVKDFKCGIHLSDDVIAANPDLKITLTLGLSEDLETAQAAEFITVDEPYVYGVKDLVTYVAKVGDKEYPSIAAAVADAQEGTATTIKVIESHTVESNGQNDDPGVITIPAGKEIILDLSGKTVTMPGIMNYGKLTVKDGKIIGNNQNFSVVENNGANAELTVNFTAESARHAIRADGGKVTVEGGSYTAKGVGLTTHALNASNGAQVTIEKGTFTGPRANASSDSGAAVNAYGTGTKVEIKAGTFSGGKNDTLAATDGAVITVTGGVYDQNPADPTDYVADGYCVKEGENAYTVAKHSVVNVPAVAATCQTEGNNAHYKCSNCGVLYEDEAGTKILDPENVIIPTGSHDLKYEGGELPTYDEDGVAPHYYCDITGCGKKFEDAKGETELTTGVVIPMLSHVDDGVLVIQDEAITNEGKKNVVLDLLQKDVMGTLTAVTQVEFQTECLEEHVDRDGTLWIYMSYGQVYFDNDALDTIVEKAQGDTVTLLVEEISKDNSGLTAKQKLTLGKQKDPYILRLQLISGDKKITSDFGGKVYIYMTGFEPKTGYKNSNYSGYFLAEDGSTEKVSYYSRDARITVEHFSEYFLSRNVKATSSPSTGDTSNVLVWAGVGMFAVAALAVLLVLNRKKKKD